MSRQLYRFEALTDADSIEAALGYVIAMGEILVDVVLARKLPIDTACLFTHDDDEYERTYSWLLKQGELSSLSHGATTYVTVQRNIGGQNLVLLGVRQPDITRPHRGYTDYPVAEYPKLVAATAGNAYAHEITSGLGKPLLELRHPDFDVLGFVVSADHALSE